MRPLLTTLRPAGNPVKLRKTRFDSTQFQPFELDFYHSGTAALAAAIMASMKTRPDITAQPEVILPAYGCPDLISAILYAGAKPVLVDLETDSSWMSLQQVEGAISDNTVAILAVRFLGIAERMTALRDLCQQHRLILIEDSAQGFPLTPPDTYWQGDFNILSFGRGKPVNLLTGGAVLSNSAEFRGLLPSPSSSNNGFLAEAQYLLKASVYNVLINPFTYGVATRLPGLNVGDTVYKPLSKLDDIPQFMKHYLNKNIYVHKSSNKAENLIRDKISELNTTDIIDLTSMAGVNVSEPLLRYPLLIRDKPLRDLLYDKLSALGASIMYKKPLALIDGMPHSVFNSFNHIPNAWDFANRLLTLPVHQGVSKKTVTRIMTSIVSSLP